MRRGKVPNIFFGQNIGYYQIYEEKLLTKIFPDKILHKKGSYQFLPTRPQMFRREGSKWPFILPCINTSLMAENVVFSTLLVTPSFMSSKAANYPQIRFWFIENFSFFSLPSMETTFSELCFFLYFIRFRKPSGIADFSNFKSWTRKNDISTVGVPESVNSILILL